MLPGLSFEWLATTFSGGVGLGGGFFFIRWIAIFVAGRADKREEQLDAGTQRLIKSLQDQIDALSHREKEREVRLEKMETDLAACKDQHSEARAEVLRLTALLRGMGDAHQHAQLIISHEKQLRKEEEEGA